MPHDKDDTPTSFPSKDLFQYRFDRVDQGLEKVTERLDNMSQLFVPRAEIELMAKERDERLASVQRECIQLIQEVRKEAQAAHEALKRDLKTTNEDLKDIKDGKKWVQRAIVGAIVSAIFLAICSLIVSLIAHRTIGGA